MLPEAKRLGELLAALTSEANYLIHVLPEWGSDELVTLSAAAFTSELPHTYNAKDIVHQLAFTLVAVTGAWSLRLGSGFEQNLLCGGAFERADEVGMAHIGCVPK